MTSGLISIRQPDDQATATSWLILVFVIVLGAVLRFWGLGNIGLHADEDVMGLATRGILERGSPILPSGMYYARALPQLYLMAMSTSIFGDTEWALRVPSVIVGTFAILIAYFLGRRFLTVQLSIGFALIVALLPIMISMSQTARMYIFYVTFVMLFAVAIFRWERTESNADYILAIAVCVASIWFHVLTIFSTLLFFFPGIAKSSMRLFVLGTAAFLVCAVAQQVIGEWVGSHYFPLVKIQADDAAALAGGFQNHRLFLPLAIAGATVVAIAGGITYAVSLRRGELSSRAIWLSFAVMGLLTAAILAVLFQYSMALLALGIGSILAIRSGLHIGYPAAVGVLIAGFFAIQVVLVSGSADIAGPRDLILLFIGLPSPWSYISFSQFAPLAVILYGFVLAIFAVRFSRGGPIPDHVLFFLAAVFVPIFVMGFFESYIPQRYVVGFLPFFALAAFAGAYEVIKRYSTRSALDSYSGYLLSFFVPIVIFVNPVDFWHNVNPQYADFPFLTDHRGVDHKGAAEFVLSQDLTAEDLVIVIDAQQQGYYLRNRLDYYMRSLKTSRNSSFMRDGKVLNLYTGTPQITSGKELAEVLTKQKGRQVLVIGSGEISANSLKRNWADGILETIAEFELEEVYSGRDDATKVWRYQR